jgi:NADH-quinone oxidoreductase subunit N
VISAAVDAHSYAIAIIGMLAAVISFFFYLRVIVVMYMMGTDDETVVRPRLRVPVGVTAVVLVALGFTIAIGVAPAPVADFARHATMLLA